MNDGIPPGEVIQPGEPNGSPEKPAPLFNHIASLMAQSIQDPYLLLAGLVAVAALGTIVFKVNSDENVVLLVMSVLGFVLAAMFMSMRFNGSGLVNASVNQELTKNLEVANKQDVEQRQRRPS